MRVLVCGSRTWQDNVIGDVLQGLYDMHNIGYLTTHCEHFTVINGGARGADSIAKGWAETPGPHPAASEEENPDVCSVFCETYLADWDTLGIRAGVIRNEEMLERGKPDVVWAFVDKPLSESRGTRHMVKIAKDAGVPTYVVQRG